MRNDKPAKRSAFETAGLKATVAALIEEIKEMYLSDQLPWIVGYSGGKDSTAALQLVWNALSELRPEQRTKPIHVISTDTLVENPIVAAWVTQSLTAMRVASETQNIPIQPNRLTPEIADTFWVNLIGRGYPAPRPKFRWCTDRLKIKPSNNFIVNVVRESGEAILVLGTRKAESSARSHAMEKLELRRVRDRLSPNASLPNCFVFSPIEEWSNDDVWLYLMQTKNPWGYNNKDLLTMYQGASEDGECPLVVDTSTPSCGDSRFGCWVCTLVDQDKSMHAMIQNDEEKEWMLPLLKLRNELDVHNDKHLRDFRRMNGSVQLFHNEPIHGPYKQDVREHWLRQVLEAQELIRANGPEAVRTIELISLAELCEIRRIWVVEKHEMEDSLPGIFKNITNKPFPGPSLDDNLVFGAEEMRLLKEICGKDWLHFELTRNLLDVERRYSSMARRAGLFEALEQSLRKGFYTDASDATARAQSREEEVRRIRAGESTLFSEELNLSASSDETKKK